MGSLVDVSEDTGASAQENAIQNFEKWLAPLKQDLTENMFFDEIEGKSHGKMTTAPAEMALPESSEPVKESIENLHESHMVERIFFADDTENEAKENLHSCTPIQVLRLLADYEYNFRKEEWELKKEFQAENPERKYRVVIAGEKWDKGFLNGVGEASSWKAAEVFATLNLLEQLQVKHGIVLPKVRISPEHRLSPHVINALKAACDEEDLSAPQFKQGRGSHGVRSCSVKVGTMRSDGQGPTENAARLEAAYKMYEAVTGQTFPLSEIIKGESCSVDVDQYDMNSNRELPLIKVKLPGRGAVPRGFRASVGVPPLAEEEEEEENMDVLKDVTNFGADSGKKMSSKRVLPELVSKEAKVQLPEPLLIDSLSSKQEVFSGTKTIEVDNNVNMIAENSEELNHMTGYSYTTLAVSSFIVFGAIAAFIAYIVKK